MHCPGAAQLIVTFLRLVLERRGQMNDGRNLLQYSFQTTIYNPSTLTHHTVGVENRPPFLSPFLKHLIYLWLIRRFTSLRIEAFVMGRR